MFNSWRNNRTLPSKIESVVIILITLVINSAYCQLVSPCPRYFKYEPRNNENDRWYGQVMLLSDSDLAGVWLRVIFDKPPIQLGNWFGEVKTNDDMEYVIKNRTYKILANTPLNVRIFVKYNPREPPPQLVTIRLNGKTYCPEGGIVTEPVTPTGQPFVSKERSTTSLPEINLGHPDTTFVLPEEGGDQSINKYPDDKDYFPGDFHLLNRPHHDILSSACGIVIKQPQPLITYGQATEEGEFPWHAALYHASGIDLTYTCGGSLISKYHLITVAHCVTRLKSETTLSPENLVVYLGKYYLRTWSNPGVQAKHVKKIIVHPKYAPQTFSNDLAILKLTTPAEITDYVRPVCLWDDPNTLDNIVGKLGTVVGWGFDETGKVTAELTKALMPVIEQQVCLNSVPEFYSRFTSNHTFCAGFNNGTSVCNGDSGGGMVFPKAGSKPDNPVWQIRGLISISVVLQDQFKCDSNHYVVFTDVDKYSNWIKNALTL